MVRKGEENTVSETTTFDRWPQKLRQERGLLNGERVQMVREARGIARHVLARKLGLSAKELAQREIGWHFWTESEKALLSGLTDFPLAFFVQDDPPVLTPAFMCGHDEEGNDWCEVIQP